MVFGLKKFFEHHASAPTHNYVMLLISELFHSAQTLLLTDQNLVVVANAMVGSRSWVIGIFNRYGKRNEKYLDYPLSPLQVNGKA